MANKYMLLYGEDSNMTMCIYTITNLLNGKVYVGQSRNTVSSRWYKHIRGDGSKCASVIHKAIVKHGAENFKFSVIDFCETIEQMDYKEKYHIKTLNTMSPNGYNITSGGGHGFVYTKEHRARLSESAKNKDKEVFKKHSEFMKKRMGTPEMKAHMSEIAKKTHTGRKQRAEQVERRAVLRRGAKFTEEQLVTLARAHMKGRIICCSNGKEYLSAYEASCDTGAIREHIGSICSGKRKSSNGYRFWYKEDILWLHSL